MEDEEYEIIPASPLRRLEKRIEKIESGSSTSEIRNLIEQIIELIKTNQRVIDDIIKSDAELRNEISKVPNKIDKLIDTMNEFMELLKAGATEETVGEISKDVMKPVVSKLEELVNQNKTNLEISQSLLESMETLDKRMKRLSLEIAGIYRKRM
jgi:methyl-accepting chemotaxis protein